MKLWRTTLIERYDNTTEIARLENMFTELTNRINNSEKTGESILDLQTQRQYVYEELTKQRRIQYERQFESSQDDYDY